MMTVNLWIYRWNENRQGIQFEIPHVIKRLKAWFSDVEVDETDYFAARTEFFTKRDDAGGGIGAKRISERDASELGPGYRFHIKSLNAVGAIERYRIAFRTEKSWTVEERHKIEEFLNSFGIDSPNWTTRESKDK